MASFLFSAKRGKIPSPLVAIEAAINAAIGKFGKVIKATATAIIPPHPGVAPMSAAIITTITLEELIQSLNFSGPTIISIMKFATISPTKTYVMTIDMSEIASCNTFLILE